MNFFIVVYESPNKKHGCVVSINLNTTGEEPTNYTSSPNTLPSPPGSAKTLDHVASAMDRMLSNLVVGSTD